MKQVRTSSRQFSNRALLPLVIALLAVTNLHAQTAPSTNRPPRPAPTWPYQVPFGASKTPAIVTPGGTFSRPQSTFQTAPGSFGRPSSTFSHPASPYTPLPPLRPSQIEEPDALSRPYHKSYPNVVVVQGPVVYEPYYIPVETPPTQPAQSSTQSTSAVETQVIEAPPVVLDLPPGAIIRRPRVEVPSAGAPARAQTGASTNGPSQLKR